MESDSQRDLEEIINDLKVANKKIIDRFEAIESIILKNKVTDEDVKYIKKIDSENYTYDEFFQISFDIDTEIVSNIVDATLSEARNKCIDFFETKKNKDTYPRLYEYTKIFIRLNKDVHYFIRFLDNLEKQLIELESIWDFCSEYSGSFNFKILLNEANKESDLNKKKQVYVDAIAAYSMYWIDNEYIFKKSDKEYEQALEHFEDYKFGCQKAIDVIDFQLKNNSTIISTQEIGNNVTEFSKFKLSKRKKTDFIKIINSMYGCRFFQTENGFEASNKQELFNEFGRLLNEDFSKYSTMLALSKKAEKPIFMKPFKDIETIASDYFDKEYEK